MGCVTKYQPWMCERIIELGKEGKSIVAMAADLGVIRRTIEVNWRKDFPEFSDAYDLARQHAQVWWENKGQENLLSGAAFKGDVWGRSMAARFPADWRESRQVDATVTTESYEEKLRRLGSDGAE